MLLAIDIGNSHVLVALCDSTNYRIHHRWRFSSQVPRTAEEYAAWLQSMFFLSDLTPQSVSRISLASVVPNLTEPLLAMCRLFLKREAYVVQREHIPIVTDLTFPDQIGIDRLVNSFAACEKYGAPALIVDFGTATTFDLLDSNSCYLGGAIAPGIELSRDSLVSRAAQLPAIDIRACRDAYGKDTVSAMRAGLYWGWVYLVEGMCARLSQSLKASCVNVIATGGLASLIAADCPALSIVDHDLMIEGLMRMPE